MNDYENFFLVFEVFPSLNLEINPPRQEEKTILHWLKYPNHLQNTKYLSLLFARET